MFQNTKALVLREVRYKESDRILTLLSDTGGKMTVKARGALRKGSRMSAATQQLCYADMTLFFNRGKWTVNEAAVIEDFAGLQKELSAFALGSYFAECIDAIAVEDQPDTALLQLGLNSLFALSREMYDRERIKAAFELRLMALAGYTPDLSCCCVCGKTEPERPYLSLARGRICCGECRDGSFDAPVRLGGDSLDAMRYILSAPAKKLFSFSADKDTLRELSNAAENYLLRQTERQFASLTYWKSIKQFDLENK